MSDYEDEKPKLRPRYEGEEVERLEGVLKRRNVNLSRATERVEKFRANKKKEKQAKNKNLVVPHVLVRTWKRTQKDKKRLKKVQNEPLPILKTEEQPLLIAVRNLRQNPSKETQQLLNQLQLQHYNNAILLLNNAENFTLLKKVSPFVFFGFGDVNTVRTLIARKGEIKTEKGEKNLPLTDNALVEQYFGALGLLCVEDVIECLWGKQEAAGAVLEKMGPFRLANLKKAEGLMALDVEQGNIKKKINLKIARILG